MRAFVTSVECLGQTSPFDTLSASSFFPFRQPLPERRTGLRYREVLRGDDGKGKSSLLRVLAQIRPDFLRTDPRVKVCLHRPISR